MDDSESPTNGQQLSLQGSLHTDTLVEKIKACLASSPDENENQLNGSKHNTLKSSDDTMGKVEQDSINNNEESGDYTSSCQEDESDKPSRSFAADEMLILEKDDSEKRSSRKTKSSSRKAVKQEKTGITATGSTPDEDGNKPNANCPQKDPTQTLQALFSLLREEFEQMDSRVLPLCLHEIAETYFQDGEYEKAMKFIQLERLYHEQLLANLSSIQQQWEKKWKAAASNEIPALKSSAKVLNNEELDRLAKLCTSHQEPQVFRSKLISKEKSLKHESFIGLRASEDLNERGAAACDSDTQTWAGTEPKKEANRKESERCESFQLEKRHRLEEKASLRLSVRKDHMEEEHSSAESALEPPTQSTETLGTPQPGCLSTKDASEDDSLQPREEQFSEDVTKIEAAAEEPAAECSSEPMVDTLVLTDADYMPPDLISSDETVQSEQNLLRSAGSVVISRNQSGSNIVNKHQQQSAYGSDRKSVQSRTSDIAGDNMPELDSVPYEGIQEETAVLEEERENEGSEDLFDQFLNSCITDREEPFKYLANQGNSEILPHTSPEQALYSSSEGYSLDESFSSLDELAKRIEIAETVPAEGLVSILKKRDDSDAQIQRRESKRRVRFLEMEDTFDQEEVGGGSCILLILLCIATVFLSVGGTALYCTLGDTESPVCTDFAANMDFYFTRIVQGVEELKHWLSFT